MSLEGKKKSWLIIAAIIMGLLAGSGLYGFQVIARDDRFPPGIYIGDVYVGQMDRAQAAAALDDWLKSLPPVPVVFTCEGFVYRSDSAGIGLRVDTKKVVEQAWQATERDWTWWDKLRLRRDREDRVTHPVTVTYDSDRLSKVLEALRPEVDVQPENCQVVVSPDGVLTVVEEKTGKRLDVKATLEKLPSVLSTSGMEIPLVVKEVAPEVRSEDFKDVAELASYSTFYDTSNVDRSYNLETAARALNGAVVGPGQEFSFNRKVGPRELKTGYREALIILGDEFAPGVGGGVCQVVSTLYNACLLAGLEIVERHNHSAAVSYVPVGLDATVNYGNKDFRFRNNTGGAVYLAAKAGGGKLTVKVYGPAHFRQRVRLERVVDKVVPFVTTEVTDNTLPPGGKKVKQVGVKGYVVRSFRVFYDDAGNVIRRETLGKDVYKPLSQIVLAGPVPPPTPPETTESSGGGVETPAGLQEEETTEPQAQLPGEL